MPHSLSPIEHSIVRALIQHSKLALDPPALARKISEFITHDSIARTRNARAANARRAAATPIRATPISIAGSPLTRVRTLTLADL